MRVDDFDFELPVERIALRPAAPRDASKLLVIEGSAPKEAQFSDHIMRDLPGLLRSGDMLVFNNTRVIPAQLSARRLVHAGPADGGIKGEVGAVAPASGGAKLGITLHKRILPHMAREELHVGASEHSASPRDWEAFIRNSKRLKPGEVLALEGGGQLQIAASLGDGRFQIRFLGEEPVEAMLLRAGQMPLPPYIASKRPTDARDADDYQTMFATADGAVAAPTAALHFTPQLMKDLAAAGISHETLTLHVGAGTFLPVKADDTAEHIMHSEWGTISAETAAKINQVKAGGGRIIAVGTTVLRLLEAASDESGVLHPFAGDTDIFITPGYRFRCIDGLISNFHLPRSTLFMLVSALMGLENMRRAYAHAIAQDYRFYSYGDAGLLLP